MRKIVKYFEKIWNVVWVPSMVLALFGGPLSDLVANEKTRNIAKKFSKAHLVIHNGACLIESIIRFFG